MKRLYDEIPERLSDNYYGKKIMAAFLAYGAEYDFCKFYACGEGTVHIYNSSMVIDGKCVPEDVNILIEMTKPHSIEASSETTLQIPGYYERRHRTLFHAKTVDKTESRTGRKNGTTDISYDEISANGSARECFEILSESFENFGSFDSWYVDISHRIRHGVSGLYLYGKTTVTKCFDIDGFVFVSGIATAASERGKGSARRVLRCLAEKFRTEGKEMFLFALDHRKTFYESVGFEPIAEDILYEMKGEF